MHGAKGELRNSGDSLPLVGKLSVLFVSLEISKDNNCGYNVINTTRV